MEKSNYESKCPGCFYYDNCVKDRIFECDHYLDARDDASWDEDYISEDHKIFNELWSQYEKEYASESCG